jgi:DNA mismatch endonuclease, patch repair protein
MVDNLTIEKRSWNMSRIRSKDTKPEKVVRSLLHRMGYRFRLHVKSLPGTPDLVLPKYRTVLFIHGCFWHRHPGCKYTYTPKSRPAFWNNKFEQNVKCYERAALELEDLTWRVLVIWECEVSDLDGLRTKILSLLPRSLDAGGL